MKQLLAFVLILQLLYCSCLSNKTLAEGNEQVFLTTHQMLYVNQFFNKDGSLSEMGLDLYKWLDMNKRDAVERINSGYLMLEEEYLYHQDTLFQAGFVSFANKTLETIGNAGVNLGLDFANHQLMKTKFGDAGAFAVPYYEYLSEIYLSFLHRLEQEMAMMDAALGAITDAMGKGANIILEDGLTAAIYVMKKTGTWNMISYHQRNALESTENMMKSSAPRLDTKKYRAVVNGVGITFDFAASAAAWYDVFVTKENLTLQQQMYMAAFSKVTNEHLDMLYELRENMHKSSSLSKAELTNIDGAIGALICDIYAARNNHMNAASQADWNAKLNTYKTLSNTIYITAEFGHSISGVGDTVDRFISGKIDDFLSAKLGASNFTTSFSIISSVAAVGHFILSSYTQDFLDIREQTKAIYNLKKAMVESLELQLGNYVLSPSHEKAVAIIASLKLVKQSKLSGEQVISLFYIAREADMFGLKNSPAAQAILWNELIACDAIGEYNLEAEGNIKPIWTIYEDSAEITSCTYDVISQWGNLCYKVVSTPVGYYRFDDETVSYKGIRLDSLPSFFTDDFVGTSKWTPTEAYLRQLAGNRVPSYANLSIRHIGNEYTNGTAEAKTGERFALSLGFEDTYFHREKEYVYIRDNVEVRIPDDEFEKYLVAEKQVEQLLNAYKNVSALEYTENQTKERLIWTKVTNGYIESFPMYDPTAIYESTTEEEPHTTEDDFKHSGQNDSSVTTFSQETEQQVTNTPVEASSTVYSHGSYRYVLMTDGTARIIEYTGEESVLEIPASLDGYRVTSIGEKAIINQKYLARVIIPNSVTRIGKHAFMYCKALTSVDIPNSVIYIEEGAFEGCGSLKSVTIPDSVTSIGKSTFIMCDSLTEVILPNSVTSIGDHAFMDCRALTRVTIPERVISIEDSTFMWCESLTSVTIPNSVTSIGDSVFMGCNKLKIVFVEPGSYAEHYCKNNGLYHEYYGELADSTTDDYEYVLLQDGTVEITNYTGNSSEMVIPSKLNGYRVSSIGDYAFSWCDSLIKVAIPDSVTTVAEEAFSYCKSLTSVTIPDSVATIEGNPFAGCDKLTEIVVSPDHPTLAVIDGVLFDKNEDRLIFYLCGRQDTSYSIPKGTQILEARAFPFYKHGLNVTNLTSVTIPSSVTSIGDYAFYGCGLTSVTIPDSVTSIGDSAFYGCNFTSVTIPSSVTSISERSFHSCLSLTNVTILSDIVTIGGDPFEQCTKLTEIVVSPDHPTLAVIDGVLFDKNEDRLICYPCGRQDTSYSIPNGTESIDSTFVNSYFLTSVTIPDSVTSIKDGAFNFCSKLQAIYVEPGSYAEQYCMDNDLPYEYIE